MSLDGRIANRWAGFLRPRMRATILCSFSGVLACQTHAAPILVPSGEELPEDSDRLPVVELRIGPGPRATKQVQTSNDGRRTVISGGVTGEMQSIVLGVVPWPDGQVEANPVWLTCSVTGGTLSVSRWIAPLPAGPLPASGWCKAENGDRVPFRLDLAESE